MANVADENELLQFLKACPPTSFVYCENDHVARMVCAAVSHLGMQIPEQFAVMGQGDYRISVSEPPSIKTLVTA